LSQPALNLLLMRLASAYHELRIDFHKLISVAMHNLYTL